MIDGDHRVVGFISHPEDVAGITMSGPDRGNPQMFTVAEAERTLPLVRHIVGDLLLTYPQWREALARYGFSPGRPAPRG